MADYYSLLARAVANLPKSSPPSTRRAIYDRARKALTTQLRSLKPQLPESDIAREERALDEAVTRLEGEFEPAAAGVEPLAAAAPAPLSSPLSSPLPAAAAAEPAEAAAPSAPLFVRPMEPAVARMASQVRPAAAPPVKPRAPTPPPAPGPAAPRLRPAVAPPGLPKARELKAQPGPAADTQAFIETQALAEPPFAEIRRDEPPGPAPAIGAAGGRDERKATRPTLSDAGGRRAPGWLWVVGAIAVGFAASIAVVAYLMRPALQDLTAPAAVETPAAATDNSAKSPRRVGQADEGEAAPTTAAAASPEPAPATDAAPPSAAPSPGAPPSPVVASPAPTLVAPPPPTAAAPPPAPTAAQALPVSSRAAMLVATVADAAKPVVSVGSVVWSMMPAPPGQPAGLGVKAEVDIPDLKMHASMILRKNLDASLPASHTIDLRVTFDPASPIKGIKDIALPLMRRDDPPAADALTGVRVKISDNYFLVGLNRGDADVAHNVQELAERSWFDFPMQLDDDRIAKLTFEKGGDGEKLVAQALAAWK